MSPSVVSQVVTENDLKAKEDASESTTNNNTTADAVVKETATTTTGQQDESEHTDTDLEAATNGYLVLRDRDTTLHTVPGTDHFLAGGLGVVMDQLSDFVAKVS